MTDRPQRLLSQTQNREQDTCPYCHGTGKVDYTPRPKNGEVRYCQDHRVYERFSARGWWECITDPRITHPELASQNAHTNKGSNGAPTE